MWNGCWNRLTAITQCRNCRNNSVYDEGSTQIRISKTLIKLVLRELHNYLLKWTKGWLDRLLQYILEGLKVHTTHTSFLLIYTHDMHGNLYPVYDATREWKSKWIVIWTWIRKDMHHTKIKSPKWNDWYNFD